MHARTHVCTEAHTHKNLDLTSLAFVFASVFDLEESSCFCNIRDLFIICNSIYSVRIKKTSSFHYIQYNLFTGLLNLFHAMKESDHMHMTFIKSAELVQYQKFWPNHVFFVLPPEFDMGSDSSIKNIIKVSFDFLLSFNSFSFRSLYLIFI